MPDNKFEVIQYLDEHNVSRYDNYDFLSFLSKIKFSFKIPFIHITGTNGKGSVANFLNNIYMVSKYKVGLFTSPHYSKYNEDISINGFNIRTEDMERIFLKYKKEINKYELSQFELLTFIMLYYFNESELDLAIIEVGMGGLYDATNIDETPLLAIINNVGIEHADVLGKSTSEIALNKAGIIKEDCDVLINILDEDCKYAVSEYAKKQRARLHEVNEFYRYGISDDKQSLYVGYFPYGDININTINIGQRSNVACAIEATNILQNKFPVSIDNLRMAFSFPTLEGRFSHFIIEGKQVIVDGAHNPHAFDVLVKSINYLTAARRSAIVGVFRDKNIEKMLAILQAHVNHLYLTTFPHSRARTEEEFFLFLEDYKFYENSMEIFKELLADPEEDMIIVTGSLYFATYFIDSLRKEGYIK